MSDSTIRPKETTGEIALVRIATYPIVEIRTNNGTVSLQRHPGISESYNI